MIAKFQIIHEDKRRIQLRRAPRVGRRKNKAFATSVSAKSVEMAMTRHLPGKPADPRRIVNPATMMPHKPSRDCRPGCRHWYA